MNIAEGYYQQKLTQIMSVNQLRPDARLPTQHALLAFQAIVIRLGPSIVRRLPPEPMIEVPSVLGGDDQLVAEVE